MGRAAIPRRCSCAAQNGWSAVTGHDDGGDAGPGDRVRGAGAAVVDGERRPGQDRIERRRPHRQHVAGRGSPSGSGQAAPPGEQEHAGGRGRGRRHDRRAPRASAPPPPSSRTRRRGSRPSSQELRPRPGRRERSAAASLPRAGEVHPVRPVARARQQLGAHRHERRAGRRPGRGTPTARAAAPPPARRRRSKSRARRLAARRRWTGCTGRDRGSRSDLRRRGTLRLGVATGESSTSTRGTPRASAAIGALRISGWCTTTSGANATVSRTAAASIRRIPGRTSRPQVAGHAPTACGPGRAAPGGSPGRARRRPRPAARSVSSGIASRTS